MLNISPRLTYLATFVKQGERVADIGTDHGYLPILLTLNGISPYVIMTDIKEGPLDTARKNIEEHLPDREFDIRLADGMTCIDSGEVDTVVIAGMGGILISEILDRDIDKSRSFGRFILQPRNNAAVLRRWLDEHDFIVTSDSVIMEGSHYCEVIVACPMGKESKEETEKARQLAFAEEMMPTDAEVLYEIPLMWISDNTAVITEYLKEKLGKEIEIIKSIMENGSDDLSKKVLVQSVKKRDYIYYLFTDTVEAANSVIKNDEDYEIN